MQQNLSHPQNEHIPKGSVDLQKLGVVLVDIQEGFLRDIQPEELEVLISAQQRIIQVCAENDYPIAILEYGREGETDQRLKKVLADVPRTDYFDKTDDDGFTNSSLLSRMNLPAASCGVSR